MTGKCGNASHLKNHAIQQNTLCSALKGQSKIFKNNWHFVTGMGNDHPVENGFTWHPTLGTPYLSGASVKGLIRAWIEEWAGFEDEEIRKICYRWFGSEDKNPDNQEEDSQAGSFIFFDALPIDTVELACDIMTPHMGKWYSEGGEIKSANYDETLPADWHNPIPVPFLVVKQASLQFCIAPRINEAQAELPEVMEALEMALEYLGAGAKTATGYGRFEKNEIATKNRNNKNQKT